MAALISSAEAQSYLRFDGDPADAGLMLMIDAASEMVLEHIKQPDADWTSDTAPPTIKLAALIALGQIDQNRTKPEIIASIEGILRPYRDPTLA